MGGVPIGADRDPILAHFPKLFQDGKGNLGKFPVRRWSTDGVCSQALNTLNRFRICRSDRTTADMRVRIIAFIDGL